MKTVIFFIIIVFALTIQAQSLFTPQHIVVFGDSLSDDGYQDQNPTVKNKQPTWTSPKGQVWAEHLAHLLLHAPLRPNNLNPLPTPNTNYVSGKLSGNDYAAGGATTTGTGFSNLHYNPPSLLQQIKSYLGKPSSKRPPSIFIWVGANNLLKPIFLHHVLPTKQTADTAVADIVHAITTLSSTHSCIVVMNLPDLGKFPAILAYPDKTFSPKLSEIVQYFNQELAAKLADKKTVMRFNTFALFNQIWLFCDPVGSTQA
jgi:phospholipase/lecithinase/hemolysin